MKSKLKNLLKVNEHIVFFGGAGVSTESGIKDFRSGNGLYHQEATVPPEILLSRNFFFEHTEAFYGYYKKNLIHPDAKPHGAHKTLAYLEACGKLSGIITQNIDNLHQLAGSQKVIELHGSVKNNYCLKCGAFYDDTFILEQAGVPYCTEKDCMGIIKPDVVLYGESLKPADLEASIRLLNQADLLIIGGTSLSVYPAASLIEYYKGRDVVIINKTVTPADTRATLLIHDNIGEVLNFDALD